MKEIKQTDLYFLKKVKIIKEKTKGKQLKIFLASNAWESVRLVLHCFENELVRYNSFVN